MPHLHKALTLAAIKPRHCKPRPTVQIMTEQFEKHKWIFEPDGSLLDIYVQETTLDNWLTLIDFLNANYKVKYDPTSDNEPQDKINKDYVTTFLLDKTGELECRTVSVFSNNLVFNCHFFLKDEIEFDADPKEFKEQKDFETLIAFMTAISKALNKEIILIAEGCSNIPLITLDSSSGHLKISTQNEIKQEHYKSITLAGRLRGFYVMSLMRLLPKLKDSKFKDNLTNYVIDLTGATKTHTATKKKISSN